MPELSNQTSTQFTPTQLPETQFTPTPQTPKHFPRPLILGLLLIILALSLSLAYLLFTQSQTNKVASINSFEECVAANGGQITLQYPPQCTTSDGRTFTDPTAEPVELPDQPDQSQVEDPTAGWQRYYSSTMNLKLSFSYPEGWQVEERANGMTISRATKPTVDPMYIGMIPLLSNSFEEASSFRSTYESSSTSHLGDLKPELITKKEVTISGIRGIQYLYSYFAYEQSDPTTPQGRALWTHLALDEDKYLVIEFETANQELFDVQSQILSTFEFTE